MLLNISRNRRHFGFTLVEVLIAVSLVGVLAAIAIPKYNNYCDRMDQSKAITDIRILQTLITDYFASGGTYPASLADVGNANLLDPWGRPYV